MGSAARWLLAALVALFLGEGAAAQGRRLIDEAEAQAWRGVGRLNIAGRRFCTATLIAPDVAVTAAHCLFHPNTRRPVPPREMRFVAGLRFGGFAASRRVRAVATHPAYDYDGRATMRSLSSDVALLALDGPVPGTAAAAFSIGPFLASDGGMTLVSYARDRAHAPSIERRCQVATALWPVAALTCEVTYGASGAPVFAEGVDGPRVVAVVSALGRTDAGQVALTVAVAPLMNELLGVLAAKDAP
jgi:V8-like Glu-specific endopeptidase